MDAKRIAEADWTQGSILDEQTLLQVYLSNPMLKCIGVVLTHSCDLRHHSFDAEPHVEIAVLDPINALDPLCVSSRHPRYLHLNVLRKGKSEYFAASVPKIANINRRKLAEIRPSADMQLSRDQLESILRWRARRYLRAAQPDGLNEALSKREKQIKRWLARANIEVSEMRIRYDPAGELDFGENYQAQVLLLGRGNYQDVQLIGRLQKLARELEELLRECGIKPYGDFELVEIDFLDTISVIAYREFLPFDLGEHLSGLEAPPVADSARRIVPGKEGSAR